MKKIETIFGSSKGSIRITKGLRNKLFLSIAILVSCVLIDYAGSINANKAYEKGEKIGTKKGILTAATYLDTVKVNDLFYVNEKGDTVYVPAESVIRTASEDIKRDLLPNSPYQNP